VIDGVEWFMWVLRGLWEDSGGWELMEWRCHDGERWTVCFDDRDEKRVWISDDMEG
jgi:hypothetical protein